MKPHDSWGQSVAPPSSLVKFVFQIRPKRFYDVKTVRDFNSCLNSLLLSMQSLLNLCIEDRCPCLGHS